MINQRDCWVLARLLSSQFQQNDLMGLSSDCVQIADLLAGLPLDQRFNAYEGWLCGRPDWDVLARTITDTDITGPAPICVAPRYATVADIRSMVSTDPWSWEPWIPANRIFGVAGFEGTGKTRFLLDLARRIWHGLEWPDGQKPTFPPRTPTLWLCADGQHDELVEIVPAFDLPDEAVVFPTTAEEPYEGTDLDNYEIVQPGGVLASAVAAVKPGLVVIDSLTNATGRDLCSQSQMKPLKTPLVHLVQNYRTSIALSLHLSKEAQVLGRRIKGLTRTLLHLECPDPKEPGRLRLWVEKSYSKKPPALGVTMTDKRNTYDSHPPERAQSDGGGRPAEAREKANQFILEALSRKNDQLGADLCTRWEETGGAGRTFWRTVKSLVASGKLATDGGKGTGKQMMVHLIAGSAAQTLATVPASA